MLALAGKLLQWNLLRNRAQTLIMILAIFGSLSSYVLLGTALSEMSSNAAQVMRADWPFDLSISGNITPEDHQAIAAITGIAHQETVASTEAYFYSEVLQLVGQPAAETRMVLELASGQMPTTDRQIVIPGDLALTTKLGLEDSMRFLPTRDAAKPVEFEVCGILSNKSGVVKRPLLTDAGIRRLLPNDNPSHSLLLQLDGKADLEKLKLRLERDWPMYKVVAEAANYEQMQLDLNMSDSLVIGLRGLILLITATSLGVLFYTSQRSGAYQTGVLRAVGVRREWLLLPALVQTMVIFALGFGLTAWLLPLISARMGLASTRAALLGSLRQDMFVYLAVGLLSTYLVNWQFLQFPIPRLFKDAW